MASAETDVFVDPDKLHALGVCALEAVGVPTEHARMTADVLLASDLRGVESHGFAHLADFYIGRIRDGRVNPKPEMRVVAESPTTLTLDADRALGFVAGQTAMRRAIEKARELGVGMAAVRNSTHFGPGFYYAMMALEHGMLGLSFTTGGNIVIPPGGARRTYGSNVIAFAAPRREGWPFVLDMATSVVAGGKFEIAARRGAKVPEGWGLDPEGRPITDPHVYLQGGGILPLGGIPLFGAWKGFGLAMMVDVLCGVLSGNGASATVQRGASHFFVALRIEAFEPLDDFYDSMEAMIERLRAAPRLPGEPPLTFAGEQEWALAETRRKNGVPLHPAVIDALQQMCRECGINYDL
jgi:LDH2 family malate/lactate/ureidoglycolate dehydrogenase